MWAIGHKTPVLQQLRDPVAVRQVGLAGTAVLDVPRVDQDRSFDTSRILHTGFQNIPVDSVAAAEAELARIAQVLGRTLPEDYRAFACVYGGAFVGGLIDGDPELPILTFLSADAVLSKLETQTDLKGDGILPVADCELGNLYVVDRRNAVHYVNYYGGRTTSRKVADSFDELLKRIVVFWRVKGSAPGNRRRPVPRWCSRRERLDRNQPPCR